jgi:IS5 family transposase
MAPGELSLRGGNQPETTVRTKQDTQARIEFHSLLGIGATVKYFARYERISGLLDRHPELLTAVHRDLGQPLARMAKDTRRGRFTSETVLRVVLVKVMEGLSFRGAVIRIDDSPRLRAFTRLGDDPMMDFSTLCLLANAIQVKTWEALNGLLAQAAVSEGRIRGERLRMDTTAVETNVHWPTDSHLLWDVHRVVCRLVRQARDLAPLLLSEKRLHDKAAKKLHTRISRVSARKTDEARKELKRLYGRQIRLVEGILSWLPSLCARMQRDGAAHAGSLADALALVHLVEQLEHFRALGLRAVDQARRRVLQGEQVPNDEKLFSIFEPHTELLIRGKAGKDVEFGHMVSIHQVAGSFITDYRVLDKRPADHALVDGALARHEKLFGAPPDLLAADKGFWESPEKTKELRKTIACVSIGKKGNRTEEEREHEHAPAFVLGQKFRAGVEGSISFLKRVLGLWRCMNKGWLHYAATVGATVFAHNLIVLARGGG